MQYDLERDFTQALFQLADLIVQETDGTVYAVDFRPSLQKRGGLATARAIISASLAPYFFELRTHRLPHRTVEGFITLHSEFHSLFSESELAICRVRYEIARDGA